MLHRFDLPPIPSSPATVPGFFVAGFREMRRQKWQNLTPKPIAPQRVWQASHKISPDGETVSPGQPRQDRLQRP